MTIGDGGIYDPECEMAFDATQGGEPHAVLLIVLQGDRGSGFSLAADDPLMLAGVPALLRKAADDIEHDLKAHFD